MTIQGSVHKTGVLLGLVTASAAYSWNHSSPTLIGVSSILGFVMAMVTCFKKEWSPVTAPAYALLEGLALGGISRMLNSSYPGIALQAVMLTFGVLFALLGAYRMGIIRATEKFKAVVIAATLGVAMVYLASMILGLFHIDIPFLHSSGQMGILFSAVVVVIAAMNLILDFSFMEDAAAAGLPKYMEWYAAFGVMVSLVWLYLEILKLLAKLSRRND